MNNKVYVASLEPVPYGDDERRTITEANATDHGFSWQNFVIKDSPNPMGNHYHERKFEIFKITKGGGVLVTGPVNQRGELNGESKTQNIDAGDVIMIPAYVTHAFKLEPGTRMECFSSAPFDPNDMDMHPCKVM